MAKLPQEILDTIFNEGYKKGRADYEAECQKIFEDNPPMHFNHEQIMWLKEFVKIRCNQARADAIDEFVGAIFDRLSDDMNTMYLCKDIAFLICRIEEQLKEQNK